MDGGENAKLVNAFGAIGNGGGCLDSGSIHCGIDPRHLYGHHYGDGGGRNKFAGVRQRDIRNERGATVVERVADECEFLGHGGRGQSGGAEREHFECRWRNSQLECQ